MLTKLLNFGIIDRMKKIVIILLLLFLSGCSWFEDKRIRVKPNTTSVEYKQMVKLLINNRYNSEYLRMKAADAAYAEYKLSLEE